MKRIGIVGGGISGLHLGLWLREYGIDATIYSEKTSAQVLEGPLRNIVIRNGCTRQRERDLRVNHWDGIAPDLGALSVTVAGTPMSFVGTLAPPSNVIDMRIYCSRLLDDFSGRGGRVVIGALAASDLDELSTRFVLNVDGWRSFVSDQRMHCAQIFLSAPNVALRDVARLSGFRSQTALNHALAQRAGTTPALLARMLRERWG